MPKLLEIGQEFFVDGKRVWGKEPFFFGEKALFRKSCTDCR
jgi:hypothetical protein